MTFHAQADQEIWTAEHVPSWQLRRDRRSTVMTDEDYAMSEPEVLIRDVTRPVAVAVITGHILGVGAMRHAERDGATAMFRAGAEVMTFGAGSVELGGRIYRVRRKDEA